MEGEEKGKRGGKLRENQGEGKGEREAKERGDY